MMALTVSYTVYMYISSQHTCLAVQERVLLELPVAPLGTVEPLLWSTGSLNAGYRVASTNIEAHAQWSEAPFLRSRLPII